MKVSKLEFTQLDLWVCRAELEEFQGVRLTPQIASHIKAKIGHYPYSPSFDPDIAFPIIEREGITLEYNASEGVITPWCARSRDQSIVMCHSRLLVAAMRCYVASKFGEEVPDEELQS
ncbi:phage protein NinX family protein [Paraburkholderia fungorum]